MSRITSSIRSFERSGPSCSPIAVDPTTSAINAVTMRRSPLVAVAATVEFYRRGVAPQPALWDGARKEGKRAGPRQYEWYDEGLRAQPSAASPLRREALKPGLCPAKAAAAQSVGLPPGVDGDGKVEHDVVRGGQVGLQARQDVARTGSRSEEPILHLLDGLEPHELVREGLGKPPPAEVPPVELLQEAGRALLTHLRHGVADEMEE